ncbi:MAG: signal peptidase I [Actinobacteria bacterium]|nr:signal peptidase I [Actinomycetota bacterium]
MTDDSPESREDGGSVAHAGPIVLPPSKLSRRQRRSPVRSIIEWIVVVAGAFGLALLIQTFLFQPFRIPSGSMIPTLEVRDRIVVNKMSYRMHPVHRGDVVVFTSPKCTAPGHPAWANCGIVGNYADLVKRVIALPGDRLAIQGNHVYVNGEVLSEPYLRPGTVTLGQPPYGCGFDGNLAHPYVIPPKMVFVMGDNRSDSLDGRCFGPIPESSLVGRAFVVIWPFSRIGWL